MYIIWN